MKNLFRYELSEEAQCEVVGGKHIPEGLDPVGKWLIDKFGDEDEDVYRARRSKLSSAIESAINFFKFW